MKSELYHRLKQVDPNLKIVSGRRLPYVLSPRDVEAMGLPFVKGRRPSEAILNLEGMYSKNDLITMAREHRLSDEGGKYELVVRLVRAGILKLENDIEEPVTSSPQTEPIWATTISKYINHLQLLYRRAPDEFYRQQKLIERAIREREEGLKKTLLQFTIGELRRALNASHSFYGPSTIPKGKQEAGY